MVWKNMNDGLASTHRDLNEPPGGRCSSLRKIRLPGVMVGWVSLSGQRRGGEGTVRGVTILLLRRARRIRPGAFRSTAVAARLLASSPS